MADTISQIPSWDKLTNRQLDRLLQAEGIQRDQNLDYTCGIFDEDWNLKATGSCFGNTLRCLAVSRHYQGEGLLNRVISHLMDIQMERGNFHLFMYTKVDSAKFMGDLGFYEIARVGNDLVFMENRKDGFSGYCRALEKKKRDGNRIAGIVMNANPFTKGHLHLVEKAAAENDVVHLFILSENVGPIPFAVRRQLVHAGVALLPNVVCHDSGPYIISSATFPSYFLKDGDKVIRTQAALDLQVFTKIAQTLGIQRRYVGQELSSHVTKLYNQVMLQKLPEQGIECIEIPRLDTDGRIISASTVRKAVQDGNLEAVRDMLPESTYEYFTDERSRPVREAICREKNVIHY